MSADHDCETEYSEEDWHLQQLRQAKRVKIMSSSANNLHFIDAANCITNNLHSKFYQLFVVQYWSILNKIIFRFQSGSNPVPVN